MSSDNWEGDRDLDEYKGQDWKGSVFGGKHGHDGKYRGVSNYGGSSGGSSGGNYYSSGGGYSRRNASHGKRNGAILVLVIGIVVGGLLFVNDFDIKSISQEINENVKMVSEEIETKSKPLSDILLNDKVSHTIQVPTKDNSPKIIKTPSPTNYNNKLTNCVMEYDSKIIKIKSNKCVIKSSEPILLSGLLLKNSNNESLILSTENPLGEKYLNVIGKSSRISHVINPQPFVEGTWTINILLGSEKIGELFFNMKQ